MGFGASGNVQNVQASVYVTDESVASSSEAISQGIGHSRRPLVYQSDMQCSGQTCTERGFIPADGHTYGVLYLIEGRVDGLGFSDWVSAEMALKTAIYLGSLPSSLDLAQMPPDGWKVTIAAGTTDEIGALNGSIEIRRLIENLDEANNKKNRNDSEVVSGISLEFGDNTSKVDVPESGVREARLRINGLETLRPGRYVGEILFSVTTPADRTMDVELRPSPVLPLQLGVPRPTARIERELIDFGTTLFETSPNFRLDQETRLPIRFEGEPFKLTVTLRESSCDGLSLTTGALERTVAGGNLPLQLISRNSIQPTNCTGTLVFTAPNAEDYEVIPGELTWQARVDAVEWSIVNSELALGDLRNTGERAADTLLVRFNGKTPFVVQANAIDANDQTNNAVLTSLSDTELDFPPVEVNGPPNESGIYQVPVMLVARQELPNDPLRGTFYRGNIALSIVGLPNSKQTVAFSFRSPTIYQRYVAPIVTPIYTMPWALCTWPLTLLLSVSGSFASPRARTRF